MDIYKLANEIISDQRIIEEPSGPVTERRLALDKNLYYSNELLKIDFSKPLCKGYNISETCNPVSCRLIIFFTDTLIPYFINNVNKTNNSQLIIQNFSAVFNFIFYLIFDKFNFNEKKWIVQQINKLFEKLSKKTDVDFFRTCICINFEKLVVKDTNNNFGMMISIKENYLNESSKNYPSDVLLEELKKVLDRCLSFWKIVNSESLKGEKFIDFLTTSFSLDNEKENEFIMFSPIRVFPNQIQLFPIKEDIGTIIFYLFADWKELMYFYAQGLLSGTAAIDIQIPDLFNKITFDKIYKRIGEKLTKYPKIINNHSLLTKFIFCSYIFIALQCFELFPKDKKYPETYDEIFTMFSNNKDKDGIDKIKEEIYKPNPSYPSYPINKSLYNFFVPVGGKSGMPKEYPPLSVSRPTGPPPFPVSRPTGPPPFPASTDLAKAPGGEAVINKRGGGSIKKRIFKKPKKTIRKTN